MNSCEFVTTITALACGIAKCVPKEELPILAAAFTQLGDTLATIITKEAALNENVQKTPTPLIPSVSSNNSSNEIHQK